jgi:CBS domain-containing protein
VKRVRNVETGRADIYGIQRDESVEDAIREFVDKDVSCLIIYEGEKLVGIFTKNDLVRCCADHPDGIRGLSVADYMKTDLFTTSADAVLDDVMGVMIERGFRHVPILDGDRVVGMLTSIDVLAHQKAGLGDERDELVRYIQRGY